jgi:hypothetical protein
MSVLNCYNKLALWYETYTTGFLNGPESVCSAIKHKYEHTKRVCSEICILCESIDPGETVTSLACITALLHDIGRYEQFRTFNTFSDHRSINHADLALEIIGRFNLLSGISSENAKLIKTAVSFHNAKTIPDSLDEKQLLLCKLIRDADKLDIFNVVTAYYTNPDPTETEIITAGLKDIPTVTPEVCALVTKGDIVDYSMVKCLNDFKLIQIGWVYDLNFIKSFEIVMSRRYLDILKLQLADISEINEAVKSAEDYVLQRSNKFKC